MHSELAHREDTMGVKMRLHCRIFRCLRRTTVLLCNDGMMRITAFLLFLFFCGSFIHSVRLTSVRLYQSDTKTLVKYSVGSRQTEARLEKRRDSTTGPPNHTARQTEESTLGLSEARCESRPRFISIRADRRWKLNLAEKYDDLVSNIQGNIRKDDTQILDYIQSVPSWSTGVENQSLATYFVPIISQMEYRILVGSFYTMAESLVQSNITFFLYGGTHLGAHRHHGIVPWDDDIDVMFNVSDKGKIKTILSNIPYYTLYAPTDRQWKFFETTLTNVLHSKYNWPFVDIFFFDENSTHIWDNLPMFKSLFSFKKADVFPLIYRPFEDGFAPIPRNSETVLRQNYDIDICHTNFYWHKYESYAPKNRVRRVVCTLLYDSFPFVFRNKLTSSEKEEVLRRGNKTLSRVVLHH